MGQVAEDVSIHQPETNVTVSASMWYHTGQGCSEGTVLTYGLWLILNIIYRINVIDMQMHYMTRL